MNTVEIIKNVQSVNRLITNNDPLERLLGNLVFGIPQSSSQSANNISQTVSKTNK